MARRFSPARLRSARRQAGYTQRKAAEALDVSYQTYQYWEQGKQCPRVNDCLKIMELFTKTFDDLVEDE